MQAAKYNVLVTRPQYQANSLCHLLEQQGHHAVRFPTLEIVGVDRDTVQKQLNSISHYQWLVFISANAVNFALRANNGKIDRFSHTAIAAVGSATKKSLDEAGLAVALVPTTDFNSEALLATQEMNNVKGKSCLIVRGKGGREVLANTLRKRGAKVDYMEVYSREVPVNNAINASELLKQDRLDVITITSTEALKNLLIMVERSLHDKLFAIPLVVISIRIQKMAESSGFKKIVVTKIPGDTAIIKTIKMMSSAETLHSSQGENSE